MKIEKIKAALSVGMETVWPLSTFTRRTRHALQGRVLHPELTAWHKGEADRVLELDGVTEGIETPPSVPEAEEASGEASASPPAPEAGSSQGASAGAGGESQGTSVRVDLETIDGLLETIGHLVLSKNQLLGMCRVDPEGRREVRFAQGLAGVAEMIDRLTGELQVTIMRTRMQPLTRLFDRYPRVVRDVARLGGKEIAFESRGGEVEVDRGLFNALNEPLTDAIRWAAGAVEPPEEREAAGKDREGTITLSAQDQGGQLQLRVFHDGCAGSLGGLAGLEAEAKRSLSARIDASACEGGVSLRLTVPRRSAIIPAIMVRVGEATFALPLHGVTEIVPMHTQELSTVRGDECVRLRGEVLGVIRLAGRFGLGAGSDGERCAIVVHSGERKAVVVVDRVLGQQEIVLRALGDTDMGDGPFSGATMSEDSSVALVIDIGRLLDQADLSPAGAASASA